MNARSRYVLKKSNVIKRVILSDLSSEILGESEVFEREDSLQETSLGFISNRAIIHLSVEIAEYGINNFKGVSVPGSEECLYLSKSWLNDSNPATVDELRKYILMFSEYARVKGNQSSPHICPFFIAYNIVYNSFKMKGMCLEAARSGLFSVKDFGYEAELERQGYFIINFLKSGKNLFWI